MKINHFNSTSSSIIRLIKFLISKLKTRIILGFISVGLLTACTAPTAMLGPAYTLSSTGNIFQTGFSYGSGKLVTIYTGKTPVENLIEFVDTDKNNIQKKTLKSDDFYILVKNKFEKNSNIFNLSNQ